jgi:hypothetical protein
VEKMSRIDDSNGKFCPENNREKRGFLYNASGRDNDG